jgi:SAM-dependent methyltransferase
VSEIKDSQSFRGDKKRLVEEPLLEKVISRNIATLGQISDNVSNKVREQYEENPYPRWVKALLYTKVKSIAEVCNETGLQLFSKNIKDTTSPKILIARCGTGQHSIETASFFSHCHVTAVDLSLSSLAYAKRKTTENKFMNIDYFQADIMNLNYLEKEFDIIESVGVLHHMSDPIAGWRVLTNLLKTGGLMKIGLYSELARQHIIRARNEIKLLGVGTTAAEMREFRRSIIYSTEESHHELTNSGDFFSLSAFRDLVFNVQEHRFTLPQIACCLKEMGLGFCGFDNKKIILNFIAFHGKKVDKYDLKLWEQYEEHTPHAFSGMYQFWCQKI